VRFEQRHTRLLIVFVIQVSGEGPVTVADLGSSDSFDEAILVEEEQVDRVAANPRLTQVFLPELPLHRLVYAQVNSDDIRGRGSRPAPAPVLVAAVPALTDDRA